MTKNESRIKEGIKALCYQPYELISGVVVAGSLDAEAYTISVQQSDGAITVEGVSLNVCANEANGMILIPEDGSNVVIGSIDGPGEWAVLKTSKVAKAIFKAGNVAYEIDEHKISLKNGSIVFDIDASLFRMNTAYESLYGLLSDLITGLTLLTVGTPSGASTVPVNVATFNSLLTRLNNLLSA